MQLTRFFLTAAVVFGLSAGALAADKEKDAKTIESKPDKVQRAKFTDFATELGLPIATLDSLGERIDAARVASNPIDLAATAKVLEAAENAVGKTASLKSETLLEEAIQLAKLRTNPSELLTLAKLVGGDAGDDLLALAEAAQDEQQSEEGEAKKVIYGSLRVMNNSHNEVHVYVNGREVGHVYAHGSYTFHVHHADELDARDHHGNRWHEHPHGHHHYYVWRLNPPHCVHHFP